MKNGLSVLMGVVVLGAAVQATAKTIQIRFNPVTGDGVQSSLWYEDPAGPSNTGLEYTVNPGITYLSAPNLNQKYNEALYRPVLPADLAGAKINSATFGVMEVWGNGMFMTVNLSRINTPATWDPGTGMHADRWGAPDNGIQQYWADWDNATTSGVRWDGTIAPSGSAWNAPTNPTFAGTAVGQLIDNQIVSSSSETIFNVLTLVQNWADGTWDNDGFVLQGTANYSAASTFRLRTHMDQGGLIIDYTPVPEPALIGVLTVGSLTMLARRRRTA